MVRSNWHKQSAKIILGLLLLITSLSSFPAPVQATTMSPTRLEMDSDPGTVANGKIKIYNDEKVSRTYYLSAANFETQGETGDPIFVPDREGLATWFNFPYSVDVGPLQYREIEFQINVPNDAEPGGYFAAIFASVIPPSDLSPGAVAVQTDVGVLILFRVNGEFATEDSIVEFDTKNKQHWLANLPVEFYFRFQNSGADRAQPLGDITVKNIFGGITKIITANRGAGNVLPKSIRRFESAWVNSGGKQIEQHTGKVPQPEFTGYWSHVQYEWRNFAFGRYSANLNVTVNNDASRTHAKKMIFWVVPWHLLLIVLLALAVFFLAVLVTAVAIVLLILRVRKK